MKTYQPRVSTTQKYSDSQGEHVVCEGKLVLIKKDEKVCIGDLYKYPHGSISLCKYGDVETANRSPLRRKLVPIIISEHEDIEVGDKAYFAGEIITWSQADEDGWNKNKPKPLSKILALPEHFSDKHLQVIIDWKMKDGDLVYLKVEPV